MDDNDYAKGAIRAALIAILALIGAAIGFSIFRIVEGNKTDYSQYNS